VELMLVFVVALIVYGAYHVLKLYIILAIKRPLGSDTEAEEAEPSDEAEATQPSIPIYRTGFLGTSHADGISSEFWWTDQARTRHLFLPGMSGFGKTSLMANLAVADIIRENGAVIVIDPKGGKQGLVNCILPHIPKHLIEKTIYLSLKTPIPLDLLGYKQSPDNFEKNLIKSDITFILQRFSMGNWGTTMQDMVNRLIPTLLEIPDTTFLDIHHFLASKKKQERILEQVSEERRASWRDQPVTNEQRGPLLSRLSNFTEEPLKTIVSGKRGEGLNIADMIEDNRIILIDLSPKSIDGLMLGALVMSKIQQAIFRRASSEHEHPICHVYADEFHNFVTSALGEMLLESRSLGLSLCMATPNPKKLVDIWGDIKAAVSSYVIFKLDGEHADMFKGKIIEPTPDDSVHQASLQAYETAVAQRDKQLRYLRSALAERKKIAHGATDEIFWNDKVADAELAIEQLTDTPIPKPVKPAPSATFLSVIPTLPIGQAIFVTEDAQTYWIQTPPPLRPPLHSYVAEVKDYSYAEYLKKRTVDKYGCDTRKEVPLLGKHGNPRPPTEDIKPGPKEIKKSPRHHD
jgi:hypothetical protein